MGSVACNAGTFSFWNALFHLLIHPMSQTCQLKLNFTCKQFGFELTDDNRQKWNFIFIETNFGNFVFTRKLSPIKIGPELKNHCKPCKAFEQK